MPREKVGGNPRSSVSAGARAKAKRGASKVGGMAGKALKDLKSRRARLDAQIKAAGG